ncbi:MAG: hypothetical protein LBH92_08640 [Bacteroidales bacterium]|jgi:hypothetical protein|nr:hypothetical protein [Bacteroidales bacterium]
MKKVIFLASAVLMSLSFQLKAQDVKKEAENVKTKMEVFSSKTGIVTKFIDTNLPVICHCYGCI